MINKRLMEQALRAGDRYEADCKLRETREAHLKHLHDDKKAAQWSAIDDAHRINARAEMLGITMKDVKSGE